jgi:hypothetical protein
MYAAYAAGVAALSRIGRHRDSTARQKGAIRRLARLLVNPLMAMNRCKFYQILRSNVCTFADG